MKTFVNLTYFFALLFHSQSFKLSQEAKDCDLAACNLPECRCSTTDIPGNLESTQIPQIVYLTFNEGFSFMTDDYFEEIFGGQFKNPNGCPFRSTSFISHQYTDYHKVNKWWSLGHEMASISISHKNNITYWATINSTGWHLEMDGMRDILAEFAQIPKSDVLGMRAPHLQNGGDLQLTAMNQDDFLYDSSLPTKAYGYVNIGKGLWPYSFDYKSTQDCEIEPCVHSSFPGIWEQPFLELEDSRDIYGTGIGEPCTYLGACLGYTEPDSTQVLELLKKNFNRAYTGNRPPFGLHMQVGYFINTWMYDGLLMFLEHLTTFDDVYVVTMQAGLEYVRNPVPLSDIDSFEPFQCNDVPKPTDCMLVSCRYGEDQLPDDLQGTGERYMQVCCLPGTNCCPPSYPWLNNPTGQ